MQNILFTSKAILFKFNMDLRLTFITLLHLQYFICNTQTAEECVYQYDMKENRVKITCGTGAVLHIVDQHGNTLLTGETSSTADTPIVFQLNR